MTNYIRSDIKVQTWQQLRERRSRLWEHSVPYIFIAPFFIGFIAFQLFPIGFSAYLSFHDWNPFIRNGIAPQNTVLDKYAGEWGVIDLDDDLVTKEVVMEDGTTKKVTVREESHRIIDDDTFKHYQNLLKDDRFLNSLMVTMTITITCTLLGTTLAVILATLLDAVPERLSMILRAVFFMPAVTSVVVIAQIWKQLFNTRYGYLNQILEVFHQSPKDWLSSPDTALLATIIMLIWAGLGWDSLIIMSGLRNIPRELYDAAKVDGAGLFQVFFRITLPLLRPVLVFVLTTGLIFLLGLFAQVQLLTNGRPKHTTETVALYLYSQGFENQNFGYAAAIAVALALIIFVISFLNYALLGRRMEY